MVDVSVCISVHNTAAYLPRCLDSVCAQTLKNLEIVIVNNGSTDNSEDIMHDYEAKHPERKFVIVAQEDRGLAQGRQTGVNHATGQYITFLDADDYVYPECYEKMYKNALETGAEIVEIQTQRGDAIISSPFTGVQDAHFVLTKYFEGEQTTKMLWLKLYKRELYDKPVLPDMYVNNEDGFAWPCLLYSAKNISYLKETLHCYSVDNENAEMYSLYTRKDLAEKLKVNRIRVLYIIPHIERFIGYEVIDKQFASVFNTYKCGIISGFLTIPVYGFSFKDRVQKVKEILDFSSYREIKKFVKKNLRNDKAGRFIKIFGLRAMYEYGKIKNR